MLKHAESLNEHDCRAVAVLRNMLEKVPAVEIENLHTESCRSGDRHDIIARVGFAGQRRTLVCAFMSNGQPRHVRAAVLALRDSISRDDENAIPLLITPYLSEEARAI